MPFDYQLPALRLLRHQLQADAGSIRRSIIQAQANDRDSAGYVGTLQTMERQIDELDRVIDYYHDHDWEAEHRAQTERTSDVAAIKIPISRLLILVSVLSWVAIMILSYFVFRTMI